MPRISSAKAIWFFFIIAALIIGLVLVAVTSLPFETIKPRLDRLASDKSLESFTPSLQARLSPLKWVGSIFLLFAWIAVAVRNRSQRLVHWVLGHLKLAFKKLSTDFDKLLLSLRGLAREKNHLLVLGIVFVLGIVNSAMLLSRPMWYDEAYTFNAFASRPLWRIVTDYHLPNNHVFHSVLVHLAYRAFGNHPWVVRLPAFLAGVSLIPAGYLAARMFFSTDTALVASALIAFFPILINYTTNARGYTLVSLFTLLLLGLGAYLKHRDNRAAWALMILFSVLGLYTVPTMLFPFGAISLWLLLSRLFQRKNALRFDPFLRHLILFGVLTALLVLLLYTPIVLVTGMEKIVGSTFVASIDGQRFWRVLVRRLTQTWDVFTKGVPTIVVWILVLGFVVAAIFRWKKMAFPFILVLFSAAVVLLRRVVPFDRMWLFAVPIFLIWAAAGLVFIFDHTLDAWLKRWPTARVTLQIGLLVLLCAPMIVTGAAYHHKRDATQAYARNLVLELQDELTHTDVVVTTFPDDAPIRYYIEFYDVGSEGIFSYQSGEFQRAIVLVNEPRGQTIESVLEKQGFPLEWLDMQSAETIGQHKHVTIYAVEHR